MTDRPIYTRLIEILSIFAWLIALLCVATFILRQTPKIRKYIAITNYEKELSCLRRRQSYVRRWGLESDVSSLFYLAEKELNKRAKYISPHVYQAIKESMTEYKQRKDVEYPSRLFSIVVETPPAQLNSKLESFNPRERLKLADKLTFEPAPLGKPAPAAPHKLVSPSPGTVRGSHPISFPVSEVQSAAMLYGSKCAFPASEVIADAGDPR